ncbi:hypothetical protein [Sphingomonas sp. MA1305]|nr:hypothetical protein [Sphingomonas sp. MA1305]
MAPPILSNDVAMLHDATIFVLFNANMPEGRYSRRFCRSILI